MSLDEQNIDNLYMTAYRELTGGCKYSLHSPLRRTTSPIQTPKGLLESSQIGQSARPVVWTS